MDKADRYASASAIEARYRERLGLLTKIVKWPAIGALIGGGALLVSRLVGPSVAEQLGASAGEAFARGMAEAQEKIAALRQQFSISGWGASDNAFLERLQATPGFAGHGAVLQNPEASRSQWYDLYEVRWLRGHPQPPLPSTLKGLPVKLVVVDELPKLLGGRGTYR